MYIYFAEQMYSCNIPMKSYQISNEVGSQMAVITDKYDFVASMKNRIKNKVFDMPRQAALTQNNYIILYLCC